MKAFHAEQASLPDAQRAARRQHIMTKINRLRPGGTGSLAAIQTHDGSILTDREQMAAELRRHWEGTFRDKPIDPVALEGWLRDYVPSMHSH